MGLELQLRTTFEQFLVSYCHFFYIKQMRSLGLYSRIDQVFDAPNAVKEVLTGQFGLEHSVCFLSFFFFLFFFFVIDLNM